MLIYDDIFNVDFNIRLIQAFKTSERSMSWLSHKLGYKHNQVHLWESGKRNFYWRDFVHLCKCFNRSIDKAVSENLQIESNEIGVILKNSLKDYKHKEVAERIGVSQAKLSRWVNGSSQVPFEKACQILSYCHFNFFQFLDELIQKEDLPEISEIAVQKRNLIQTLEQSPFIGALAPALCLKSYKDLKKHKDGFLAEKIGISLPEEKVGLEILVELGQIYKKDGLYHLKTYRVKTGSNREGHLNVCRYWSSRVNQYSRLESSKSLFGYRVFGISKEGFKELREAHISYYHAISDILKTEQAPFDHVVAVNFHALVLDEK